MKRRPHKFEQVFPTDIALYREVCYETARKEYNMILDFYERPVRFLTFRDLALYYEPTDGDMELFFERYVYLRNRG